MSHHVSCPIVCIPFKIRNFLPDSGILKSRGNPGGGDSRIPDFSGISSCFSGLFGWFWRWRRQKFWILRSKMMILTRQKSCECKNNSDYIYILYLHQLLTFLLMQKILRLVILWIDNYFILKKIEFLSYKEFSGYLFD